MTGHTCSETVLRPTRDDEILVGFGIDERFTCHLAVTLASILKTAPSERFRFLVVHKGVGDDAKRKVERCAEGHCVEWHDADDSLPQHLKGGSHVSIATYFRLLLPSVAPQGARRLIYLDCDTVVCRSLRELWEWDLGGFVIAAAFDAGLDSADFANRYKLPQRRLGYFNAGVLLLDLEKVRSENLFAPVFDFLANCTEEPRHHDQDALNFVFWDRWTRLDLMWNLQRRQLLRSDGPCFPEDSDIPRDRRPKIIHYTEQWKPWTPGADHPYMWAYFRIAKKTPWGASALIASQASRARILKWRLKHVLLHLMPSLAFKPRRSIERWRNCQ